MLQEKSRGNSLSSSTTAVGNLRVYKLMVTFFSTPAFFVPVYAILVISSYFELVSAVETFAWIRDVSSPLLYSLVIPALPISLWFVLRMAFLQNHCPAHSYCSGLSLPVEQYKSVNRYLGLQFAISLLSAGIIFVCAFLYGLEKVIRKPPIFKVTLTATSLPTEHVCLAFLIFELQLVLHMLHLESTFAPKSSCPEAWKSRWRNLRTTVTLLLTGLCLVGVFKTILIYRTLKTNSVCWSGEDWDVSVTVAVLIVSSICGTDYNGIMGALFRFFLLAVSFRSVVGVEGKVLPVYQILLGSLATTLVHMVLSTKLYETSKRPMVIFLIVMFLSNAVPLLLQTTCIPPPV
jgi:hypothetical protein